MRTYWYTDLLLNPITGPVLTLVFFSLMVTLVGAVVVYLVGRYPHWNIPWQNEEYIFDVNMFTDKVVEYLLGDNLPSARRCNTLHQMQAQFWSKNRFISIQLVSQWLYLLWKQWHCWSMFRTLAIGLILVGSIGHLYYYFIVVQNLIRPNEQVNIINRVPGLVSLWIISSDGAGTCRVFVAIGSVMVMVMIYQYSVEKVRLLSRSELLEEAIGVR